MIHLATLSLCRLTMIVVILLIILYVILFPRDSSDGIQLYHPTVTNSNDEIQLYNPRLTNASIGYDYPMAFTGSRDHAKKIDQVIPKESFGLAYASSEYESYSARHPKAIFRSINRVEKPSQMSLKQIPEVDDSKSEHGGYLVGHPKL